LGVRLLPHDDRLRQEVFLRRAGQETPLLSSVEGTAAERWPASPALQSLHVEERGGGVRVALLVGIAGRTHWSASIAPTADGLGIEFDCAARVAEQPEFVGSTYRAHFPPGALVEVAAESARLDIADRSMICTAAPGTTLIFQDRVLRFASVVATTALPHTVRWSWTVRLS
jgi:hypothetical protein